MQVEYLGQNAAGYFCFGDGASVVTDILPTMKDGVAKFGHRISTGDASMIYSGPHSAGMADAMLGKRYACDFRDDLSRKEYGMGYLAGLLRAIVIHRPAPVAAVPESSPAPEIPVPIPVDAGPVASAPLKKFPKKSKIRKRPEELDW